MITIGKLYSYIIDKPTGILYMELSNDDAGIPFRKMEISTEIYPAILWEDRGGMIHTQLFVGHI